MNLQILILLLLEIDINLGLFMYIGFFPSSVHLERIEAISVSRSVVPSSLQPHGL